MNVRGWLHGNCVLVDGDPPGLVDTGYHDGADLLVEWVSARVPVSTLGTILLTHVHSDHAGGVATVRTAAPQVVVHGHPVARGLVERWIDTELWIGEPTGQQLPRFTIDENLPLGGEIACGSRTFTVIDTPGHAKGGVAFFDEHDGVLIAGDALWENGMGILNPWSDGPDVYEAASTALDNLSGVDARYVVGGHGPPFTDVAGALERARARLDAWAADPARLRRGAASALVGFWWLAHPRATVEQVMAMAERVCETLSPLPGDVEAVPPAVLATTVLAKLRSRAPAQS